MVGLGLQDRCVSLSRSWAPDVYQGSPAPTTAFLAVGSKAAGIVLADARVLFGAVPEIALHWERLLMFIAAVTNSLRVTCGAIPHTQPETSSGLFKHLQCGLFAARLRRDDGFGRRVRHSLLSVGGYLFTVLAAFVVIGAVSRQSSRRTSACWPD